MEEGSGSEENGECSDGGAWLGASAARKWREPSWEPGPWARVVSHSKAGELVHKLVTQVLGDKLL